MAEGRLQMPSSYPWDNNHEVQEDAYWLENDRCQENQLAVDWEDGDSDAEGELEEVDAKSYMLYY